MATPMAMVRGESLWMTGPRRDSRPDDDTKQKLGLAHTEYTLDRLSNFSVAQPRSRVPGPGQPLARTTQK
eukprot:7935744-Pyramimonas_sp.AAC.1